MKIVNNNKETARTGTVYTKNDTEQLWSIGLGVDYDQN